MEWRYIRLWKTKIIERDGTAYAKEVHYSDEDSQVNIQAAEGAYLGTIWISKKQLKEIYELITS